MIGYMAETDECIDFFFFFMLLSSTRPHRFASGGFARTHARKRCPRALHVVGRDIAVGNIRIHPLLPPPPSSAPSGIAESH